MRRVSIPLPALYAAGVVLFTETVGLLGFCASGLLWNSTSSMPEGLYLRRPLQYIARGQIVAYCPTREAVERGRLIGDEPDPGPCPSGTVSFLKRVVAAPGDVVRLTERSMIVNGSEIPKSGPYNAEARRLLRTVAPGEYRVKQGEAWVLSENPGGYDSRYYGPITPSESLVPVFVWKVPDQ